MNAGGLAGFNIGSIVNSYATGNVSTGDSSIAGGLVSTNNVSERIRLRAGLQHIHHDHRLPRDRQCHRRRGKSRRRIGRRAMTA